MASKQDERENGEGPKALEFEPVLRPRQQVEKQLKEAILDGSFQQGDRLPSEGLLAEQLSVSRATVREALRSLVESGFITKKAGARGGSVVQYVDHHAVSRMLADRLGSTLELGSIDYGEVADFRNMLEVPSARLAAENRTEEQLEELRHIIDLEKEVKAGDASVPKLNEMFHSTLAEASGNLVLAASISALHRVTHPLAFIQRSEELGRDAVRHHIAITSAVQSQDPDAAASAMEQHLQYLLQHAA